MRRLGYLKPLLCKVSRSELFPNSFPRKGMETLPHMWRSLPKGFPFQTHFPARGWKPSADHIVAICSFQLSKLISPQGDGNILLSKMDHQTNKLSKLISPQGDGNCLAVADPMMQSCFPNSLPRKGMETRLDPDTEPLPQIDFPN